MKLKTLYGLPSKVVFCKKSLISNQRPTSAIEFLQWLEQNEKPMDIVLSDVVMPSMSGPALWQRSH